MLTQPDSRRTPTKFLIQSLSQSIEGRITGIAARISPRTNRTITNSHPRRFGAVDGVTEVHHESLDRGPDVVVDIADAIRIRDPTVHDESIRILELLRPRSPLGRLLLEPRPRELVVRHQEIGLLALEGLHVPAAHEESHGPVLVRTDPELEIRPGEGMPRRRIDLGRTITRRILTVGAGVTHQVQLEALHGQFAAFEVPLSRTRLRLAIPLVVVRGHRGCRTIRRRVCSRDRSIGHVVHRLSAFRRGTRRLLHGAGPRGVDQLLLLLAGLGRARLRRARCATEEGRDHGQGHEGGHQTELGREAHGNLLGWRLSHRFTRALLR